MPVYDFDCEDCGQTQEVWASLDEFMKGLAPVCEHCGSRRLTRKISAPSLGSRFSSRLPGGSGCAPGAGGGCCG